MNIIDGDKLRLFISKLSEDQLLALKNDLAHMLIESLTNYGQFEWLVEKVELALSNLQEHHGQDDFIDYILGALQQLIECNNLYFSTSIKELSYYPYWEKSGCIQQVRSSTKVSESKIS